MINNKTDLIISIIINLGTGVANYLKESVIICPCQVLEVDQPNKNNVKKISEKIVQNWKRMIRKNGKLPKTSIDIINIE